ncbi:hypothetical protein AVEN_264138-1 [Araneus ventricosus]|uniref:Uncharacterized protein n=1 Tax=Araneus ventricosus TaxID=182803 RepID=A0A4Y2HAG6_ARAVE|nr:hypothetical protein AVEN_264138-1 [Araneus ventricosus]
MQTFLMLLPYSSRNMMLSHAVHLNGSRCNSSSAEAGILLAITGHVPTPPVGGMLYHRHRASPKHFYSLQGSETLLTSPATSDPRTRCHG